jgi:hypothetical protein
MKVFHRCVEAAKPNDIRVATTGPAFIADFRVRDKNPPFQLATGWFSLGACLSSLGEVDLF